MSHYIPEAETGMDPEGNPPRAQSFPCSATQERCWFLDRMSPGTPALNVAIRWNVTGRFITASFEAAFRAVIVRHEILRTAFAEENGLPVQRVMEEAAFHLSEIDIRATPKAQQAERVEAIANESARLPFDLTQPGAIRATLIRLGNDCAIMAITAHQICFDGWSIGILGREIGALTAAFEAGDNVSLPELPLQYADYSMWQREYFDSAAYADDLTPWRKRLEGAPYFELAADLPRPLERSAACAMVNTNLPPAFGDRLSEAARGRAMSPFAYGAGVLSALLARAAETSEVTIGTQVAGRTEVDLEPLIGVFINNVVLRFVTPQETTLGDHLDRTKEVVQQALVGQHVPFNKLVEMLNPPRDPSRTPLISVNFILQHAFMETVRYGDFELSSAPSHAPGAIYDLSFVLIGRESGWRMTLEYNSDLFEPGTAEDLLALWHEAFTFAFDHPNRTLAEMPARARATKQSEGDAHDLTWIENVLAAHSLVGTAAAVAYSGAGGARRIHVFVEPDDEAMLVPLETLPSLLVDHIAAESNCAIQVDGISILRALPRDDFGRVIKARLPLAVAVDALPLAVPETVGIGDIEARLALIWVDLLGLKSVPPSANFFDLGGHSLLTVRMLARIEREFGKRLSLASVYHSPTLRALARRLGGATAAQMSEADWRVTVLSEVGEGVPLIAINNAKTVYALVGQLSAPRPALAVRIHDKARGTPLLTRSFTQIAAEYVDAVRSAQPHGPYALFGVCVHGNLAIEVARQLKAEGEEVAAVIMKDVWEPRYGLRISASRWTSTLDRLHFVRVRLRFLRRGDISLAAFMGMFRVFRKTGILAAAVRLRLMERVRYTDLDAEQEEFIHYLSEARNRHQPEPYDGRVLHFVTSEAPSGRTFDPEMGWGEIVRGELETRHLNELSVTPKRRAGVTEAAKMIDAFLALPRAEDQVNAK